MSTRPSFAVADNIAEAEDAIAEGQRRYAVYQPGNYSMADAQACYLRAIASALVAIAEALSENRQA